MIQTHRFMCTEGVSPPPSPGKFGTTRGSKLDCARNAVVNFYRNTTLASMSVAWLTASQREWVKRERWESGGEGEGGGRRWRGRMFWWKGGMHTYKHTDTQTWLTWTDAMEKNNKKIQMIDRWGSAVRPPWRWFLSLTPGDKEVDQSWRCGECHRLVYLDSCQSQESRLAGDGCSLALSRSRSLDVVKLVQFSRTGVYASCVVLLLYLVNAR